MTAYSCGPRLRAGVLGAGRTFEQIPPAFSWWCADDPIFGGSRCVRFLVRCSNSSTNSGLDRRCDEHRQFLIPSSRLLYKANYDPFRGILSFNGNLQPEGAICQALIA